MRNFLTICFVSSIVLVAACGGGSSSSAPTSPSTPSTPAPAANRAPVVNSINVTPSFGISELTSFTYSASASDPDGDPVSFAWDLAGNAANGPNGSITFVGSGTAGFKVTISDGKGGTASDTRTITVGNATGTWRGTGVSLGAFTMVLTQTSAKVSGSYSDNAFGAGKIDPRSRAPSTHPGTLRCE